MRFSIFSLPLGSTFWACMSLLLSQPAAAATQQYLLDTSYSGSTFFSGWNFLTTTDPTHGFVQYLSQSDAQNAGLISQGTGSPAYMGVDHSTTLSTSAQGRNSVRITTQKSWTHGLFIADIAHMPDSTCGVWPAFWMFGPNWPSSGEIDIIEGVSRNTQNLMSLHTGPNCVMTAGTQSGTVNSLQCDGSLNGNSGCGISSSNDASYGTGFDNNGGGVYATEWTSNYIQTWFFPKGSVPNDITTGNPSPSGWGTPQSSFQGGSGCDIDTHFMNQNLVFDTTFCGDWAGNVWGGDPVCAGLASSCVDYVAGNPSAFSNTYWQVNSVKVYQLGYPTTTSSATTFTTSTKSSSSSTSTTSSSVKSMSTSRTSTSSSKTTTSSTSSSIKPTTTSTKSTSKSTSSSSSSVKSSSSSTSKPVTTTSTSKSTSTTSTKTSSTTSINPSATWTSLGCYSDNVNHAGRALPNEASVPNSHSKMTVEACEAACKAAGYVLAGLEYSDQCWCGNSIMNGGAYVGADGTSGCDMACSGNAAEWCGGSNRLSVWKFG